MDILEIRFILVAGIGIHSRESSVYKGSRHSELAGVDQDEERMVVVAVFKTFRRSKSDNEATSCIGTKKNLTTPSSRTYLLIVSFVVVLLLQRMTCSMIIPWWRPTIATFDIREIIEIPPSRKYQEPVDPVDRFGTSDKDTSREIALLVEWTIFQWPLSSGTCSPMANASFSVSFDRQPQMSFSCLCSWQQYR